MKKVLLFLIFWCSLAYAQAPDSARLFISQGNTYYTTKNYPRAIEAYRKAMDLRPLQSTIPYNIACCYSLMGNHSGALEYLARAIELGSYSFDQDEDFNNIRGTKGYKKLLTKATKLLAEARMRNWEPVVLLPDQFDSTKAYPLLVALHGYGGEPVNFSQAFRTTCNRLGYILCCPYAPEIQGLTAFSWGDLERSDSLAERRIMASIALMRERYRIDTARTILCGFSQGGALAYRMGLKHAPLFRGAVPIAGFYDTTCTASLPRAREAGFRLYILLGQLDSDWLTASNLEAARALMAGGISYSLNTFAGVGHAFPGDADVELGRAIEWIEQK